MARLIDAKCRECRRIGEKLFLKGERCYTPKCAMVKRPYPPGAHGKTGRRGGPSEFGRQLRAKQRVKKTYGVLERQIKKYFREAQAQKGDSRENLMKKLEMRLDNVVYRLGWMKSRASARQLVNHGQILVNGKRVDIPSFQVKTEQVITLSNKIKKSKLMENLATSLKKYEPPKWLVLDKEKMEARILGAPDADDLGDLAPVGMIVEFYSR
ncbi:MAG TPA: 30S ribosomal protein S4 [Candidatus Portnoybacteria bacterium]|uniref:Small ribosomal subunit protein uS4 n=1 Tax=Candidatus Portnoybacteria bacterium CG02_land_8_20_14_3_00_45_8 TaxID=1974807 RepID=A0A2M7D5Q5_9BACT|nr:MAG: 30S ribosomal protein S4 [Candidatus Portnoybacteria bacterium CG02_land_8_20_14_3_00_45_8]HCX27750.1 30S ribosomal protein S4 [Candidatus Portnoybacteria bacterium]